MIKFVIVDDDSEVVEKVKKVIGKTSIVNDEEIDIKRYSGYTEELEKEIGYTDIKTIYILDIELKKGISGIQIAEKIRKNDWESEIIFITNHDKMFETVYRSIYDVFSFIEKFHNFEEKLETDLKNIFKKNFDNKMLIYTNRSIDLKIYYRNILYIYRDTTDRKIYVITTNNHYIINLNLTEIMEYLDERFQFVHRACIANLERIEEYNWTKGYFGLDTGKKIDLLSKKYRKNIEEKCHM